MFHDFGYFELKYCYHHVLVLQDYTTLLLGHCSAVDTILIQPALACTSYVIVPIALRFRLTHSIHLCFGLPLPRRLLPCGTISVDDRPTISWSRLCTCPNHLSLVFLHLSVMFSSFSISLMLSALFSRSHLLFGLSTHIHLCPYQFLHASHRRCLHLLQHSLLNNPLVNLSINKWWYPHVARDPGIVLQLFNPHCVLLFTYIFMSPLVYRVRASQTFEFGDLKQLENCILTLPAGIPLKHVYSLFSIDTFVVLLGVRTT